MKRVHLCEIYSEVHVLQDYPHQCSTLHFLCFTLVPRLGTAPRMRNPLQVYKDQLPVWIHHVQDGLELWVHLSLLHYWQVVPQGSQTGLELLMIQLTRLVLVKVPV